MRLKWNLILVHLDIVLVLVQDWCTVCAKRTIGSEIILDTPDGTPTGRGSSVCFLVLLMIVLILMQDRALFASNIPLAQKSFWTHPMELLGDVGHLDSRFFPFGDSVSFGARWVLRQTFHRLRNHFGRT